MSHHKRREFLTAAGLALAGAAVADDAPRKRIKVGQIGVGHAHAGKLAVYRKSAEYEVVGIVEEDEALRRRAQSQEAYKGLKWMSRDDLLGTPGLQAVLVETRVADLLSNAEACVKAGKHVHIDKPPGESLPRLRKLLESADRQKLMVQMGYMYRYNPGVVLLRELLKKGVLGEVFEVHAVMSKVIDPVERGRLARFAGGILFELGCHVLDLVIAVLGRPKEVTAFNLHSSRREDKLLDNMLAVLTYPRATATVKSSALEVEGFDRRHLVVCGTEGTLHIQPLDNPAGRLSLAKPYARYKKGTQEVRFPRYVRYVDDAADMARVIRGEKANEFSSAHDLAVQETLLRACGRPLTD